MTTTTTPYRAIFCDLRSDDTIDILPLRDVTVDDYIGKPGSLSGTVPVPDAAIAARVRRIEEGRTAVYLQRGNDLWWGGIIWTSTLQSDDRGVLSLGIQAATFESYAGRRRIRDDLNFRDKDQLVVARKLWEHLQTGTVDDGSGPTTAGGDIGVTYGYETSGLNRSVAYRDGDETVYLEALDALAALENGFEHHIGVYRDPVTGERVRRLRLGSPRILIGSTDLVLDRPGTILSYSFPRDATRGGTTARARGATDNTNQAAESRPLYADADVAVGDTLIAAGYPRVDLTSDHNDVASTTILRSLANAELTEGAGAVVIPEISVRLDGLVPPALLGRTVRLRITDEWWTEGLDTRYRIVGVKVSPAQRGRPDTAELYLEEA
ncbi:hypothetical protein JCM4814A_20660 [Streptomyces phaeofaciens JCM 4814]|uniref:Minor tail protein n=1 Tax=Streptomyces phaeofaciens TaxID=68254 RepID=A0A918HDB7_9ACTN|nr:hypothetical protein [Streptomyces phaeofaciens]GGT56210.1 hypothetical protein GCM10010226_36710 [Streptomyces phaeofaciens]